MRTLAAIACLAALAVAGCGEDDEPPAAEPPAALADLTVAVDADGDGGKPPETETIRCGSAGESERCAAVADLPADVFEPTPRGVACTQQYGGPETASVTGTWRGEPVDARFSRTNGCEIARWEDAGVLLEP